MAAAHNQGRPSWHGNTQRTSFGRGMGRKKQPTTSDKFQQSIRVDEERLFSDQLSGVINSPSWRPFHREKSRAPAVIQTLMIKILEMFFEI
ncbi:MAG: hypothetical protein ACR2II_06930 [Chthoniobacterales bacterium]